MTATVLVTKLFIPPTRPNLVQRPRLQEKLTASLSRKLTLLSAPAGFGKSTLVTEWAEGLRFRCEKELSPSHQVAWLSLDANDNDVSRFLTYLLAAFQQIDPDIAQGIEAVISSSTNISAENIIIPLINDLASRKNDILLVLDDYHLIELPEIHQAIAFFIDNLPRTTHLIIITREDPPLPLSRLRARDQLVELRAADLRFTKDEATDFLNQIMDLELTANEISSLDSRTEGWIAGLQLAAISIQGREDKSELIESFTGSNRLVLDYLVEEVLNQLSPNLLEFLLISSIPERITASLCNHLLGRNDSEKVLQDLERSNLFLLPIDNERRWYRYHHLFADLLHQRVRNEYRDELPHLKTLASEWFEINGFMDEAIEYALKSDEKERAVKLILSAADEVWARSVDTSLRLWLSHLEKEQIFTNPSLCIFHAWYCLANGQLPEGDLCLRHAEKEIYHSNTQLDPDALLDLKGRLAVTQAFGAFYHGDQQANIGYAKQALELLPPSNHDWRRVAMHLLGDGYTFDGDMNKASQAQSEAVEFSRNDQENFSSIITHLKLALVMRYQGKLPAAMAICKQQKNVVTRLGLTQTFTNGWLLTIWGELLAEQGHLDDAIEKAEPGLLLIRRGGDLGMLASGHIHMLRILYSRGEYNKALEVIGHMTTRFTGIHLPTWLILQKDYWHARTLLAKNDLSGASHLIDTQVNPSKRPLDFAHEPINIISARILLESGSPHDAISLLRNLYPVAESGGRISRMIEIRMLTALGYESLGDEVEALKAIEEVLALTEPGGFIQTFVDEGPKMGKLLTRALSLEKYIEYINRILQAFPAIDTTTNTPSGLIEPLSDRELEVLQLIAKGLTNQDVGEKLFLSLNTVKAHTRNIYGKLGVNNRTQAVAKARGLGLITLD